MFHSFPKRGLNSYKRGRYIRGQAPLAIHTNHSLIALIICPHAHTCACACACVDIRNYSHKQLDLYTFTHTHQPCTLSPSLHSSLRTSHTITHTVTSMEQFNMAFRAQQPTLRGKMEAVRDLLEPQPQIGGRPNARPKEGNGLGKA